MEKSRNKEIAETILNQIGGNKFIVMTGSNNFVAVENGLRMDIRRNRSKANMLTIELKGDDTYTMKFEKFTKSKMKADYSFTEAKLEIVKKYEGVYFDMLEDIFTEVTGLYTRL